MDTNIRLTTSEGILLRECETTIERGLSTFMDVGEALLSIRDRRLYRNTHPTFEGYCQERWGMSRSYAHRTIEAAQVAKNLLPIGNIPTTESQARPLARLAPDEQAEVWRRAVETVPGGNITARHVQEIVDRHIEEKNGGPEKAHVAHNTGENEWYTPPEYTEAARNVMGSIDLDPASCEFANTIVQAEVYFDKEQNGLLPVWFGRVWLNPPYAQPDITLFTAKLLQSIDDGDVEQACVLVNNATETEWFQPLLARADAVCFPKSRIKFIDMNGEPRGAPLQGQVVLYFGGKRAAFDQWFSPLGVVLYGRH